MALRGLDAKHEQDASKLLRDTRTLTQRIGAFFANPNAVAITIVVMGVGGIFVPSLADILLLVCLVFFLIGKMRRIKLPFRLPQRAKVLDYNDLYPTSNKPRMARGIHFFGNEKRTRQELWFSNEDMRTHVLILGSTGSGKTETLVSLAYSSLLQGSGFIYVDGKGDNALYAKIFSMVRYMGREDDLLLINFMTGAKDIIGPQEQRLSNTLNPFSSGSSSMLSQLVISMMDSSSASGDGDMWKGRAIAFVEGLMKVLVAMRDAGYILLDANTIRLYFPLEQIQSIVEYKRFPREGQDAVSLEFLPDVVLEPLKNYLINLPGYNREKKNKQVSQVFEQHGFITMQLTRVFTSLADTYGHILRTKLAEVDLKDVVLNRRILVVLLPALEKSPDELANLGKVVVSSLKTMMAAGLGEAVEGEFHDLIQRKPTNAPTPYVCILDEYGYYAVKGFAVVPAQARSLGFSVIFAGQDLPSFERASKEEALSICANTNITICMKLEDAKTTWEYISSSTGEAYVTHVSGFQSESGSVTNAYADTRSASVEKRHRVDLFDLKDQREGEAHILFQAKIIRANTFYANPPSVKSLRLNQLLKVDTPKDSELFVLVKGIEDYEEMVNRGDIAIEPLESKDSIEALVKLFDAEESSMPIERGIGVLLAYHENHISDGGEDEVEIIAKDTLNIFTAIEMPEELEALIFADNKEKFSRAILKQGSLRSQINYLERLSGSTDVNAKIISEEIVKDMANVTEYPPEVGDIISAEEILTAANTLIKYMTALKEKSSQQKDKDNEK